MNWIAEHWSTLAAGLGSAGVGGVIWKLIDRWLTHQSAKRKQTDEVAMGLVEKLSGRIDQVEQLREADRQLAAAEHAACEARLSSLRHELRRVEGKFEAMILAVRHAPERAAEIVADVLAWERDRKADAEKRGELRNEVQTRISAERVVGDAKAAGAG